MSDQFILHHDIPLQRVDFGFALGYPDQLQLMFSCPMVEAQPIDLKVLGQQGGIDVAEAAEIEVAAREQRRDPFLLQQQVLCARFQPGQFRIRDHGLQAHQRLILLDDLSFLDQDLFDDASLEMLHRPNLGHRDELAAGHRELTDRGQRGPRQRAGTIRRTSRILLRETTKPRCSSNSIGVASQSGVSDGDPLVVLLVTLMTSSFDPGRASSVLFSKRCPARGLRA